MQNIFSGVNISSLTQDSKSFDTKDHQITSLQDKEWSLKDSKLDYLSDELLENNSTFENTLNFLKQKQNENENINENDDLAKIKNDDLAKIKNDDLAKIKNDDLVKIENEETGELLDFNLIQNKTNHVAKLNQEEKDNTKAQQIKLYENNDRQSHRPIINSDENKNITLSANLGEQEAKLKNNKVFNRLEDKSNLKLTKKNIKSKNLTLNNSTLPTADKTSDNILRKIINKAKINNNLKVDNQQNDNEQITLEKLKIKLPDNKKEILNSKKVVNEDLKINNKFLEKHFVPYKKNIEKKEVFKPVSVDHFIDKNDFHINRKIGEINRKNIAKNEKLKNVLNKKFSDKNLIDHKVNNSNNNNLKLPNFSNKQEQLLNKLTVNKDFNNIQSSKKNELFESSIIPEKFESFISSKSGQIDQPILNRYEFEASIVSNNKDNLIHKISDYITKIHTDSNDKELGVTIQDNELGEISFRVLKNKNDHINSPLTVDVKTHNDKGNDFFNKNKDLIINHLSEKGINITEFKVSSVTSSSISNEKVVNSELSFDMSDNDLNFSEEKQSFAQEKGKKQESQKRRELWNYFKNYKDVA